MLTRFDRLADDRISEKSPGSLRSKSVGSELTPTATNNKVDLKSWFKSGMLDKYTDQNRAHINIGFQ